MINKVRAWEAQKLRLTYRSRMKPDETWVTYIIRTSRSMRTSWKNRHAAVDRENCEHNLDDNDVGRV